MILSQIKQYLLFILSGAALLLFAADYFVGAQLQKQTAEYKNLKKDSEKFLELKNRYKTSADSKKTMEALAADISKTYFSATISKKDLSSANKNLNLLILNSDELDMIVKKVLSSNLKITKLWISDAELGYMLSIEVSP